ncbi:MAG: ribonuclease D [Deltaproteobacteria bacterium]|nr:ribonuclease D [Deltaproteobacteria bacterium]
MPEARPCSFIDTQEGLSLLLQELAGEPALALDTESNSFHAYYEKVCLLQLSTRVADYVLDPFLVDVRPLGPLLADPAREVVLHAADYDIRSLKRDFGFLFGRLFDTMLAAKLLGRSEVGLAALVRDQFGVRLAKEHQRSDWGRRPLSPDQVAYAYRDTRYLLPLRDLLAAELQQQGKVAQARGLFDRQASCKPRPKRFDEEGFRHIRGFKALDAPSRAVARALYLVREERARAADRPPFKIFGEDALLELARCRPQTCGALSGIKGLGSSTVRRDGEAIVGAIVHALEPATARSWTSQWSQKEAPAAAAGSEAPVGSAAPGADQSAR